MAQHSVDRRETVTRRAVLDAARRLIEQQGVAGLSMRKLAAELGVAVTSIYWHVGNREALLDELVQEMVHGLDTLPARGTAPAARVLSLAMELRRVLREHPHLIGLVNERGLTPAMFLPSQRTLAAEISAAGLRGARAAEAVRALQYHVIGFVLVERHTDRSPEQRPSAEELWQAEPAPDAALAGALATPVDADRLFAVSTEALVRSLLADQ
ncbi:TetR/AcrR family tetracycline transcriptional repressor [Catenulispora sp. GP43]|uniref:TetR/AcrR family transcriptional regulator n=1 Tax=Catenulispora sp. GP43 TaxID=3156263 RepID=UPI0035183E34